VTRRGIWATDRKATRTASIQGAVRVWRFDEPEAAMNAVRLELEIVPHEMDMIDAAVSALHAFSKLEGNVFETRPQLSKIVERKICKQSIPGCVVSDGLAHCSPRLGARVSQSPAPEDIVRR
jgi:hypothetical protein